MLFKKPAIWRGLALIMVVALVAVIGIGMLLESEKVMVDTYLGTQSSIIVTEYGDEGDKEASYNYKPDVTSIEKLVEMQADVAERAAEEGAVLLKNNGALPLSGNDLKVTLLGIRSRYPVYGGTMGSVPEANRVVSPVDSFKKKGYTLNQTMVDLYDSDAAKAFEPNALGRNFGVGNTESKYEIKEMGVSDLTAVNANFASSFTDYNVGIVTVGRPSAEAGQYFPGARGTDTPTVTGNVLSLSNAEMEIVELAKSNFDKVIILVNSDSAMEIDNLQKDDKVDAILWIGAPGCYGFLGAADVLKGDISPSGHLGDVYAVNSANSPAAQNLGVYYWKNTDVLTNVEQPYAGVSITGTNARANWYLMENESIYVGYMYYETRYADAVMGKGSASSAAGSSTSGAWSYKDEVTYPFGRGLSYTKFTQTLDRVSISSNKKTAEVTVTVKNTGSAKGKSVVQLYAQAPYTQYDITNGVEKSAIRLMDFEKTAELDVGASETVTMNIDMQYIASYDETEAKTYILDEGTYYFAIGDDSHDALNNILAAQGYTTANGMTYNGDASKTYDWTWDFDENTFATSKTMTKVTNQLDDADFNYYQPGTIKTLTRNDWSGSFPKTYASETITLTSEALIKQLLNDTYEIKKNDDTSDILWNQPTDLTISSMKGAAYDDYRWDELLNKMDLEELMYTIVNAQNILKAMPSIGLLDVGVNDGPMGFDSTPMNSAEWMGTPLSDATGDNKHEDADKGTRVIPTAVVIGYSFSKQIAAEIGNLFGNQSILLKISFQWAPGMNLHRTPYNARNHEYFSEDPILAGMIGSEMCQSALKKGLIMSPKHFAFNCQESNRAAVAPFMTEQKAREHELRGFQIVYEDGALGMMTAFNRIGATFASAHIGLMQNILREEWGFKGYCVTDMINGDQYMTLKESVMAGTTNMDTRWATTGDTSIPKANWPYWTKANIQNDRALLTQMKQNAHYFLYAIVNSNAMNGINTSSHMEDQMTWWRALYYSLTVVFAVLAAACVGMYVAGELVTKSKKERGEQ